MRTLADMRLIAKLLMPIALMTIMVASLAAMTIRGVEALSSQTLTIVDQTAVRLQLALQVESDANAAAVNEKNAILETREEAIRRYRGMFEGILGRAKSDLDQLASLSVDMPASRPIHDLSQALDAYAALGRQVIAFSLDGDSDRAFSLSARDGAAALSTVTVLAAAVVAVTTTEFHDIRTAVDATATALIRRIVAAILVGTSLVLGAMLVIVLVGVARPIGRLAAAMHQIAAGAADCIVPDRDRRDEVGGMAGAVQVFKENMYRARHDPLTGLLNRLGLVEIQERYLESGVAGFVMLCLDLDGFKQVNDTLGHHVGDALLQGVARRLDASIRPGDAVCRLGGDEFVILIRDLAPARAEEFAARVIERVAAEPYLIDGINLVRIGLSIGFVCAPDDGAGWEELHRHADKALYAAKLAGKGVPRRYRLPAHATAAQPAWAPRSDAGVDPTISVG